jgi:hypothetical protein
LEAAGHFPLVERALTAPNMKEPIDFSDRERFVLSYYRDPSLSSWSRHAAFDIICVSSSLLFIVLFAVYQDVAWGLVGYGTLVWRVTWGLWRSRQFTEDLRSVIRKYDAKIQELTAQPAAGAEQK